MSDGQHNTLHILMFTLFLFAGWSAIKVPKTVTVEKIVDRTDSLTPENLWHEILRAKIKFPEIVYAQAMIETGNLKCKDCSMNRNNLFGFQVHKYLTFDTWMESVWYYKYWQRKYKGGDYYQFLINAKFAEDTNYTLKLKRYELHDLPRNQ